MAKKSGQLHIEVNNDEEWEKLMLKDGLIVVDIYSDWCGPCTGMSATLKKIKLEVGGDLLVLALAKCDNITALSRFRYKSEPTWMFISKGKKTNILFGANAPEITRVVIDEINKERKAIEQRIDRPERTDICELHEVEKLRYEEQKRRMKSVREKDEAKRIRNIRSRKIQECKNILSNVSYGVILIFPCARDKYQECINDYLKEASCEIAQSEKINLDVELLDEMFYFYEEEEPPFDEPSLNSLLGEPCEMVAVKGIGSLEPPDWETLLSKIIYGKDQKNSVGDRTSFYQKMLTEVEDENTGEVEIHTGVWVPKEPLIRATMLRMFFAYYTKPYEIPDPGPDPPHYAMVFDTNKIKCVLKVMGRWSNQFLHYGFFTKEDPDDTQVIAKSVKRLETLMKKNKHSLQEKLVVAVSKKRSELILELLQLGPIYMSTNTEEGARDSAKFFPLNYGDSLSPEEKVYRPKSPEPETEISEMSTAPTA